MSALPAVAESSALMEVAPALGGEPVSSSAKGYTALWRRLCARLDQAVLLSEQAEADSARVLGLGLDVLGSRYSAWGRMEDWARTMRAHLVQTAAREFGAAGARAPIDECALNEALGEAAGYMKRNAYGRASLSPEEEAARLRAAFDPDAIWRWLEATYGGEAGERAALAQVGRDLASTLRLESKPPSMRRDQLVIELGVWSEKHYSGKTRSYSYGSVQTIREARQQLAAFAMWAGDVRTANMLKRDQHDVLDARGRSSIVSREKFDFGSIVFVTFSEKIEIVFNAALAAKFRLFVAKFGGAK